MRIVNGCLPSTSFLMKFVVGLVALTKHQTLTNFQVPNKIDQTKFSISWNLAPYRTFTTMTTKQRDMLPVTFRTFTTITHQRDTHAPMLISRTPWNW